jgi:transcription antitermination factor NusG
MQLTPIVEGFFGEKPTEKVRWDSIGGAMFSIQQASTTNWQPEVPIPENHDWYALQTRVRFERKICQQLQDRRQAAYVPVTRERRRWSDRYQTVELPLFAGYVFVGAVSNPADRLAILQTSGAYRFVTFKGVAACIPDRQINDLRRTETQNSSWSPYPFVKSGQRVRICGGCLDGLEGIFVAERGRKLVISIEPMQRSVAIDLASYDVEAV